MISPEGSADGLRPRGRPGQVPRGAGQAPGARPGRHPRPDAATSTSPATATTRSPPCAEREPVTDDVDVVIVGGGIAGVLAGAQLRRPGIERIRIVDQAGGIGGTWYWNRYPGVMCDVESYIYLPMLEELDYVPPGPLRLRRGDPPPPRRPSPSGSTSCPTPCSTPGSPGPSGTTTPAAGGSAPTGATSCAPLLRAGRRHPQPDEAAGHPRDGGLRRPLVPLGPVGLRLHRRRPGRAADQPRRQGRRR